MQVKVREGDTEWGWGIMVCVTRRPPAPNGASNGHAAAGAADQYLLDTLLPCAPGSVASALSKCASAHVTQL
jgi:ATP-dependent RNA helicase DOB1